MSLSSLKKVLMLRSEVNDLSAVALVTGNVRYTRSSLSTSLSMPLKISLWLSVSNGPHKCHLHMDGRTGKGTSDGIWQHQQLDP